MKNVKLKKWVRLSLVLCAAALLVVLVVPIWQIQLDAPQYPEGLVLLIYAGKLGGSVDIINGLNHYIGMRTLHAEDFIEFTLLRYIISGYAILFLVTAVAGKRKLLYTAFAAFVVFGIVAMVDFWKWEYNYGHNLNPDAPIKVPGMAYQPPLIGYKQLLNFGAYSIPDIGGWIFVLVGLALFVLVAREWKYSRVKRMVRPATTKMALVVPVLFVIISLVSCDVKPQPFQLGKDNCTSCKMTISDPRFGAEIITVRGKIFKFDDVHCLLSYLKSGQIPAKDIRDIYLVNFSGDHGFIPSDDALLLKSDALNSPMNGNVAAFASADSLNETLAFFKGTPVNWKQLSAQ